jgi:FlaG/FlaF family flagellin (archaellin)
LSSSFLNNLRELEHIATVPIICSQHDAHVVAQQTDSKYQLSMKGKVVLDLTKDPDPYGYHGIPLSTRLQYMGWT